MGNIRGKILRRAMRQTAARLAAVLALLPHAFAAQGAEQAGKWQVSPATGGGQETLTLSLAAENPIKGWMKTQTPLLTIRCSGGKADLYVETGLALEVTATDQHVVRVQLDEKKAATQRWREVTNSTLSPRDAAALIRELAQSRTFSFWFTPFGAEQAQARFTVGGLAGYLPQLARSCWGK